MINPIHIILVNLSTSLVLCVSYNENVVAGDDYERCMTGQLPERHVY